MQKKILKLLPALLFLFAIPAKAKAFAFIPVLAYLAAGTIISYFAAPAVTSYVIGGIAETVIRGIAWFILNLVLKLLEIANVLFLVAIQESTSFSSKLPAVEIGWTVVRDATNIFFIVILLFIAIGTILRIQGYSAKQLLVRLILMAVLINFSLAIGSVIIDFSNVLGLQFLTAIHPEGKVTEILAKSLSIGDIYKVTDPDIKDISKYLVVVVGNAILISVLVFVFFVSAILLFIRMAVLVLLLTLAPIAFLFYILPETQKHWSKWWNMLIQYSFFFPAFMFFLYFSIIIITNAHQQLVASGKAGPGTPKNFIDNMDVITVYFISITFLLASLIMGKQMGIAGSNAVIGWAKAGRKYVTGAIGSGALYSVRGVTRRNAGNIAM